MCEIDYKDTFSPVVKFASNRTILAFAAQEELIVYQMDVVTAFLNGHLEEEIYIEQPEGCIVPGNEAKVLKLRRSIYGLKQSPRCWNKVFSDYLEGIGLTQSEADPCIYIKLEPFVILAVYVDDLIIMTKSEDQMMTIKEDLKRGFKMKDLGELHYCLGISVVKDHRRGSMYLHQRQYIKNMLQKFGLQDAKEVSTPFDHNQRLVKDDGVSKSVDYHITKIQKFISTQISYAFMYETLLNILQTALPSIRGIPILLFKCLQLTASSQVLKSKFM